MKPKAARDKAMRVPPKSKGGDSAALRKLKAGLSRAGDVLARFRKEFQTEPWVEETR